MSGVRSPPPEEKEEESTETSEEEAERVLAAIDPGLVAFSSDKGGVPFYRLHRVVATAITRKKFIFVSVSTGTVRTARQERIVVPSVGGMTANRCRLILEQQCRHEYSFLLAAVETRFPKTVEGLRRVQHGRSFACWACSAQALLYPALIVLNR